MAKSGYTLIGISKYLVCLCFCLYQSEAVSNSLHNQFNDYYRYSVDGHVRSKRYVENVISRLADNYASDTAAGHPLFHEKDTLHGWTRQGRMELVGNVAVPVNPFPNQPVSLSESHPLSQPGPASGAILGGGDVFSSHSNPDDEASPPEHVAPVLPHDLDKTPKPSKKTDDKKALLTEPKKFEGPKASDAVKLDKIQGHHEEMTTSRSVTSSDPHNDEDYDVNSGEFPQEVTNNTLEKNNITDRQEDHHIYYNSTFISNSKVGQEYWVNLEEQKDVVVHEMLSTSHRRAVTVKLSFDFPFYGHTVRNMTIATGGFLYTGDYIHSWLAATQYIAPLMANFDTSLSEDSHVKYRDNGTALTVEWERVALQDKKEAGEFSFQATLFNTGDIVFVYRQIPLFVDQIEDMQHPVKVGLSDAYIIDKTIFYVRRKTIYEYHRVNFKRDNIRNWTVIYLSALPTCMDLTNCTSCLTTKINFECSWCESVGRCSSGFDRRRQEWQTKQCELTSVSDEGECSQVPTHTPNFPSHRLPHIDTRLDGSGEASSSGVQMSGILGLFVAAALVSGLAMWLLYAYRNPHTPSGQLLIKYRPSQWSIRRGEARYTAASIHM